MARTDHSEINPAGSADQSQQHDMQHLPVHGDGHVDLPDAGYVTHAQILRDGVDLILRGDDGHAVIVDNYFALDPAPVLTAPNGAALTPDLVQSFVQSLHPQYAAIEQANDESAIGIVQEVKGDATLTHTDGSTEAVVNGMPIYQGDVVETDAQGSVNIVFVDETSFAVSSDARMAIDEYIFDPDTQSGTTNFSVLRGMFVFTSGLIGRDDPDDVEINTPVGSIGIRGTTIAGNVDTGEITVVEGAIVLRATNGQEITLATQYDTGRFVAQGGVEHVGVMDSAQIGNNFASMGTVAPAFFVQIGQTTPQSGGEADGGAPSGGAEDSGAPVDAVPAPDPNADVPPAEGNQSFDGQSSFDGTTSFDAAADPTGTAGGDTALLAGTTTSDANALLGTTATGGTTGAPAADTTTAAATTTTITTVAPPPSVLTSGGGSSGPVIINTAAPVIGNGGAVFGINENVALTTAVGSVLATDVDGNPLTYTITGGNTGGAFAIDGSGNITVNSAINYEALSTYTLTVNVSDGTFNASGTFTINISDINEIPVHTATALSNPSEASPVTTVIYNFTVADPEGAGLTYSIIAGNTGSAFNIDSAGVVTVATVLDAETTANYNLTLRASDGTNNYDYVLNVAVGNVDDTAPTVSTNTGATVNEGSYVVLSSSNLSLTDVDTANPANLTYNVTGAATNGYVAFLSATGTPITAFTQADINAGQVVFVNDGTDGVSVDSFTFSVTDSGSNILSGQTFNIGVTAVNDAPTVTGSGVILGNVSEDAVSVSGDQVSAIATGTFDADTGASTGIAITGVDNSNGQWQYLNGSWFNITGVSDNAALLLDSSAYVRFVPNANYNGTATFDFKAWDQTTGTAFGIANTMVGTAFSGGSDTATVSVLPVNDAPVIDLDANDSNGTGLNYDGTFTTAPVAISDSDAAISDVDSGLIQSMTVTLSNIMDVSQEYLVALSGDGTHGATGITISGSNTGTITLSYTGGTTYTDFLTVLSEITYDNVAGVATNGVRDIQITVTDDGGASSGVAHSYINVTAPPSTTFTGSTGNDNLTGTGANETFISSAGADSYAGGGGIDTIDFTGTTGNVTVNLQSSLIVADGYGNSNETLTGFTNVIGGDGSDVIFGSTGNNDLRGGLGADTIDGGGGSDNIYGDDGADVIIVNNAYGSSYIYGGNGSDIYDASAVTNSINMEMGLAKINRDGGANTDNYSQIENFILGSGADSVTAAVGNYNLNGGAGLDSIDYNALSAAVTVDLATGTVTSTGMTHILANFEQFYGTAYNDTFTGNSSNNEFYGGAGADTFNVTDGTDIYDGGAGVDIIDFTTVTSAVTVDLLSSSYNYGSGSGSIINIESIFGSAFADTMVARSTFTEELHGGAGNDTLRGYASDSLYGGTGADILQLTNNYSSMRLDGGLGIDTVSFLSGGVYDFDNLTTFSGNEKIDMTGGVAVDLHMSLNDTIMTSMFTGQLDIWMDSDDRLDLDLSALTGGYRIVGGGNTGQDYIRIEDAAAAHTIILHFDPATNDVDLQGLGGGGLYLNFIDPTEGFRIVNQTGIGIGTTVLNVGDRDSDGRGDFAFTYFKTGVNNGAFAVYESNGAAYDNSSMAMAANIQEYSGLLNGHGDTSNMTMTLAGDYNGDGVKDFVIGALNGSMGGVQTGAAQIISGADMSILQDFSDSGSSLYAFFGQSVAGIGDVNNDGYDDVLIGAGGYSSGTPVGAAYVLFGSAVPNAVDIASMSPGAGFMIAGGTNMRLGTSVSSAGDFNGDGIADFMMGAPGISGTGLVKIVFGQDGLNSGALAGSTMTINGVTVDSAMRDIKLFDFGDFNGDGHSDIGIGATGGTGDLYVFYGGAGRVGGSSLSVTAANLHVQATAGFEIVGGGSVGDFNGDGRDDFALAFNQTGTDKIDIYVVYGGSLSGTIDNGSFNPSNAFHINYTVPAGSLASDANVQLSSAGDVNGDGFADLAIGISKVDSNALVDSDTDGTANNDADGFVGIVYGRESGSYVNSTGTSSAANETLLGDAGNNTFFQSNLGHTGLTLLGGDGNDTARIMDNSFRSIDMGLGQDALEFTPLSGNLDFSGLGSERISGVDKFIFGNNGQTLTLTMQDLFGLMAQSDSGHFTIAQTGTGNALRIDVPAGSATNATAASIQTALGADGMINSGTTWDFYFGGSTTGHVLSIDQSLVGGTGQVDII